MQTGELPSEWSWELAGWQGSTLTRVRLGGGSAEVGRGHAAELAEGGLMTFSFSSRGPLRAPLVSSRSAAMTSSSWVPDVEPSGDSGELN